MSYNNIKFPERKPDITFSNGIAECGCLLEFVSGEGEYSDGFRIWLCNKHKKKIEV